MTGFKKLFYGFAGFISLTLLLQIPFAFGVSHVIGDKTSIDTALQESGAYEKAGPLIIEDIAKKQGNAESQNLLNDPKAREAVIAAIKPADVRSTTQSVINPLYDWLEGRSDNFTFKLDLTTYRDNILTNLGTYAEQRANTLPVCTLEQLQTINFNQDFLSIPCVPPGITASQVRERFISQATAQSEFLRDPVITSEDITAQSETQQNTASPNAPDIYQNFMNGKWTTLALAIIALALLVFARHDRRAGALVVGKLFVAAGVTLGLGILMYYFFFSNIAVPNPAGDLMVAVIRNITDKIVGYAQWFVLGYLALGIALLLKFKKATPQATEQEPASGPVTSV